jgi:PLP dependent protein
MAIPPLADDPEEARPYFAALRELRDAIAADHPAVTGLSMGMSDDFEVAISEGATSIRVGRAIFAD